ncbi:MAG: ABC transporter permease [bacterium]
MGANNGDAAVRRGFLYYLKRDYNLYLMLLPGFVICIIFRYVPMYGIIIAFRRYYLGASIFGSEWVGLKYFRQFFQDPYCFRLIRNTFILAFYSLLWGFPAPIILALLLNEVGRSRIAQIFKRFTQSASYLPHFISTVVVVGMLFELFSIRGVVNRALQNFGVESVRFIGTMPWFRVLYVGSGIWQGVGWGSIIYLAALSGIPVEQYEAAIVDGANRWQRVIHITLPGLLPTIGILWIFAMAGLFDVSFERVYLLYSPPIYEVADVIETYVYRRGIIGLDYSYAAAVGLFRAVLAAILLFISNWIARKTSGYGLW